MMYVNKPTKYCGVAPKMLWQKINYSSQTKNIHQIAFLSFSLFQVECDYEYIPSECVFTNCRMTVNYSCSQCECEYITRHVLLHHIKSDTKLFLPHTPCPAGWPQGTLHSHHGLILAAAYWLLQADNAQAKFQKQHCCPYYLFFFLFFFSEIIYLLHSQYYIIAWPDETVLNKKVLIQFFLSR